jgi:hypothetical protein
MHFYYNCWTVAILAIQSAVDVSSLQCWDRKSLCPIVVSLALKTTSDVFRLCTGPLVQQLQLYTE